MLGSGQGLTLEVGGTQLMMTIATTTVIDATTSVTTSISPDPVGQVALLLLWVVVVGCIAWLIREFSR